MKLVGIVGSISDDSYNKILMNYIGRQFSNDIEFEILDIKEVPLFSVDKKQEDFLIIDKLNQKISEADGVILATPEHNHTLTAALKNVLEWLSYKVHPFENKPVLIVGASYFSQGSSRAQLSLRQVLDSPGINAIAMPGNEFLLGNVRRAFDKHGNLKDERTKLFLNEVLSKFIDWIKIISKN